MRSEPKKGHSLRAGATISAILHGILIGLALAFLHGTSQAVPPKAPLMVTLDLQPPAPKPKPPPSKPKPPPPPKPLAVVKPTPAPAVITSRALTSVPIPTAPPDPGPQLLAVTKPLPDPPKHQVAPPPIVVHHVSSHYKQKLLQQIGANLRYPASAARRNREGTALVRITMARNGTIQAIVLVRGTGTPSLDREAQRVFQRIGRFPPVPADFAPLATEFEFVIPITFKLVDG